MLIFDELKKNDPQLRVMAMVFAAGLCILLAGLWWVQVVSAHEYQSHLETQAYRTVRLPAVRGKILDREGRVLAENRPRYDLSLYLDDLHGEFQKEFNRLRPLKITTNSPPFWKLWVGSRSVVTNNARLGKSETDALWVRARYNVAYNLVAQMSRVLQQPLTFDPKKFERACISSSFVPYPILSDMTSNQVARFEENFTGGLGVNLDVQSVRVYPSGTTAAHLLGYVQGSDESMEGEDADFSYRLPDYIGKSGVEINFDAQLHGHAGTESVLINSKGYRQSENVWLEPEPGDNVVLTIDLDLQRAAEKSIVRLQGADVNAAVVVMDVRSGDVLALVSSPTFDPNDFAGGISAAKWKQIQDLQAEKNRATIENYAPGSIFKTVVALAALENGLNPDEKYYVQPNPEKPGHGCIYIGKRKIEDTAPPGEYDFKKAFIHSSNAYFVTNGLRAGIENIIRMGEKFDLGERTGLFPHQETRGDFPTLARVESSEWRAGDTANVCIGQGEVAVTPIQMAVMVSAIANGGKVLWPQIVDRIEPQGLSSGEVAMNFPSGRVRGELNVHPRSLEILHAAMLADVETSEGTAYDAFHSGGELKMQICGKTGTAQVQDEHNKLTGYNFWFASYAPYENPKYAVVVMVQGQHGSGGETCAPIAHDIYEEIVKKENASSAKALARN